MREGMVSVLHTANDNEGARNGNRDAARSSRVASGMTVAAIGSATGASPTTGIAPATSAGKVVLAC
ncbi:hypothetical protein FACS1894125_3340 [Actinomycetota bacterium]|nr:hypothetical protein FACS1894125_3340 [Actinomycetota bacterium]